MVEWISIKDAWPPPFQKVDILWDNGTTTQGCFCSEFFVAAMDGHITHWRPAKAIGKG